MLFDRHNLINLNGDREDLENLLRFSVFNYSPNPPALITARE